MAKLILAANKPREHKRLGRRVKPFDGKIWNKKCEDIVKRGNLAKVNEVDFPFALTKSIRPDRKKVLLVCSCLIY